MSGETTINNKPVSRENFVLVTNPEASYEDYGWTEDYVRDILYISEYEPDNEAMSDDVILNDLGIIYNDAIGARRDIQKAIKYYSMAMELGNNLAMSNLADIYRKGSWGAEKNPAKAFELYKRCTLPYAYFRVGEAYENGWGVEKNLDEAKANYRIAYKAGHPLARKKLSTFNFLK